MTLIKKEGGIERTVFPAIDNPPDGSGVFAQDSLVAGLNVDSPDSPVHAGSESLAVVDAETDVHNGGAVLEGAHQAALARLAIGLIPRSGLRLVQVHVLVPGGSQQARGRVRGEGEGGDGVVRRLRELELRCCF